MKLGKGILIGVVLTSCTHNAANKGRSERAPNDESVAIKFDHTYRETKDGSVYKNLVARGFRQGNDAVNHPGRRTCEFIHLSKIRQDRGYIEFCFTNPTLPTDYGDANPDPRDPWPGFALSPNHGPLKSYFESNKKNLEMFKPTYTHKNYEWAKDSKNYLPGWNNVGFEHKYDPFPGIYTWILEYEDYPNQVEIGPLERSKTDLHRLTISKHPNTSRYILGFLWSDEDQISQANLEKLTGGRTAGKRTFLMDGTWVEWTSKNSDLGSIFRDKSYPFFAVVLGVDSLKTFREVAKPEHNIKFNGQDASMIRLGPEGWDIIAVEIP